MRQDLLELVLRHDELAELDVAERRLALRELLTDQEEPLDLPSSLGALADAIDGFGPLGDLMRDDEVSDVLVNGTNGVWVESAGALKQTPVRFGSESDLSAFVDRLLTRSGARVDMQQPIADARLPDGSRIHVVLPPIAPNGPLISIRRFRHSVWTIDELREEGMLSADDAKRLSDAVVERRSIAISGGTGSGKTTLLNAMLALVGANERVLVIEETQELRPSSPHQVGLLTRSANIEGKGAIEMQDLVRAALRMRPDRIVIGEVRGAEAAAALAAMSVGHKGSMVTVHARSAAEVVERFTSLALLAGHGGGEDSVRRQVLSAFDLFVHLERSPDGLRKVTEIVSG